jgi:hypothetical protein
MTAETPDDVVFVDSATPPGANYVGRYTLGTGRVEQVERPPLTGHVHLRTDGRCLHNNGAELCGRLL